jgi:GntR family transcriptional regulator
MLLNLTDLSDEPLQSQISKQIRALILSGELAAGTTLPSIRRLAKEQHVSVITVQRGYETLEREGLIHSRRGKGFFVSELDRGRKREMARDRLVEQIKPIVNEAFSEGMSGQSILAVIKSILGGRGAQQRR